MLALRALRVYVSTLGYAMARLLLVEDDADVAELLLEVLREEGLALLAAETPDAILCDVEMPVLSGPEMVLEIFLRDAAGALVPILLTSGVADLRVVARTIGTPYFLKKPFTVKELIAKVNLALTERTAPHRAESPG